MRDALEIDNSIDILDYIHSLPAAEQSVAQSKLQAIERNAMLEMEATPGVHELLSFIDAQGVPKAILTRNFPIPVTHLLDNVLIDQQNKFAPVITRDFKPPKPSPLGLLEIARQWGVDPTKLVMVGDSIDDVTAGRRAGAGTILIRTHVNEHVSRAKETDVTVENLQDITKLLEDGFESKVNDE